MHLVVQKIKLYINKIKYKYFSNQPKVRLKLQVEDFREHTFTIDELPSFNSYRIKLLLTSTNQANPPRIRNLRVIALA